MENFYVNGLRKIDVTVSTYDIATGYFSAIGKNTVNKIINKISPAYLLKQLNKNLLHFILKKKFDVILIFKGMQLYPETVKYLKQHTAILANYNPDHPFRFFSAGSGNKNVLNSIGHYDIYFSYSLQITAQLNSNFNTTAFTIPFGYDDTLAVSTNTAEGINNKILFIGSYDRQRALFLNKIAKEYLYIYGDAKWHSRNVMLPGIREACQQRYLYNEEYKQAVAGAAGIINLMREQNIIEQSHNMRTFEVPGFGGVLISQRTTEQLDFFEEDKEAVYFDSAEELKSKIHFLVNNPAVVSRIKEAAHQRSVRSEYSYTHRSFQLLQKLKAK